MHSLLRYSFLVLMLGSVAAPFASAQEQPDAQTEEEVDPSTERATSFRAVDGPVTEDVPGGVLMIVAYAAIWVLVFGYVWRLGRMSAQTAADVRRLSSSLADATDADDEG
jgi:CcmD family protein